MADAGTAAPVVLPWMRVPLNIAAGSGVALEYVHGLHPKLLAAVQGQLGFVELFPVQAAVWRGLAGGSSVLHDMCICAPTGSGKTLAYALPMLNAILTSYQPAACSALRGLVVLPTRSLAAQVHEVLHALGAAAGVHVVLAAAQESVAAEAARLFSPPGLPGSGPHILVATPGRLMAHLQGSSGAGSGWAGSSTVSSRLCLRHLKFLVVDEADRLLRQDYHGWLPQVLTHLHASSAAADTTGSLLTQAGQQQQQQQRTADLSRLSILASDMQTCQAVSSSVCAAAVVSSSSSTCDGSDSRVVKLVVSATLTRDPSKLMRLQLHCPRFIALTDVHWRYTLPPALQQHRVVVPAQHKPLALVGLLHHLAGARGVVFASSLEMTHRLQLLLEAVPGLPGAVAEYSSHVTPEAQVAALSAFRQGQVHVLVTSDAMARGMDVSGIDYVINYDPPTFPKTYVHRAGRTARAGSAGAVYTLLKPEDVVHFSGMLRKVHGSKVQQVKLPPAQLQELRPALKVALQHVQELVQLEQQQQQQLPQLGKRKAASQPATIS